MVRRFSFAAVLFLYLSGNSIANHLISTDGAVRWGTDLNWWGSYVIGDQWVSDVVGQVKRTGSTNWPVSVAASWGGFYWEAYTPTTIQVGQASVRGKLYYEDPDGNPHVDISDPIDNV